MSTFSLAVAIFSSKIMPHLSRNIIINLKFLCSIIKFTVQVVVWRWSRAASDSWYIFSLSLRLRGYLS